MDPSRVRAALEILTAELADVDQMSDEARASLNRLADDIRQLLDQRDRSAGDDAEAASALKDALLEFEAEHPQLTGALNSVAAALANLGI